MTPRNLRQAEWSLALVALVANNSAAFEFCRAMRSRRLRSKFFASAQGCEIRAPTYAPLSMKGL